MEQPTMILVVDDEEVVLAGIEKILKREGMGIRTATSAEKGLELLAQEPFDVVIADLKLPGMDGLGFLSKVREQAPAIPTILITGYATIQNAIQALKIGAVEYLPKPFTRSEFRGAVHRALRRRSLPPSRAAVKTERPAATGMTGTSATSMEPGSVYRLPEHMWIRVEAVNQVKVGLDPIFIHTLGTLRNLVMPATDDFVGQGRPCIQAEDEDGIAHSLSSPISGRVAALNDAVVHNIDLILTDPEGEGWLFLVEPGNLEVELASLIPG